MDRIYNYLSQWIRKEGHQIDYRPDAFTLELNRLSAFDPFNIPDDEIQDFDFDLLYPIK